MCLPRPFQGPALQQGLLQTVRSSRTCSVHFSPLLAPPLAHVMHNKRLIGEETKWCQDTESPPSFSLSGGLVLPCLENSRRVARVGRRRPLLGSRRSSPKPPWPRLSTDDPCPRDAYNAQSTLSPHGAPQLSGHRQVACRDQVTSPSHEEPVKVLLIHWPSPQSPRHLPGTAGTGVAVPRSGN